MGRLRIWIGALACSVATIAWFGEAQAATPVDVAITAHTERGCPDATSCTFTATEAIIDSGTVSGVLVRAGAANSPVTGVAQYEITFNGQLGSLTIRMQTRLSLTDVPWLLHEDGLWTVIGGTGEYAGANGQGMASGTRDFLHQSLDLSYSGRLQLS